MSQTVQLCSLREPKLDLFTNLSQGSCSQVSLVPRDTGLLARTTLSKCVCTEGVSKSNANTREITWDFAHIVMVTGYQ